MADIIAPKLEAVVIEAREETTVIAPQQEAVVIEVGQQGPAGTPGTLPDGTNTGDIIRYNAATGDWESCAEPFEFQGIVLVPMALPGAPEEGFICYRDSDNGLYVAVE